MSYITADTIRTLREQKKLTQKQLAEKLMVSDKTISKWETGRGLPDIGIIEELARSLDVSLAELLAGEISVNSNRSANMKKTEIYVCPVCGNVILSTGKGSYSCCGINLPALETEPEDDTHAIRTENVENELYISIEHQMTKEHYISFFLYVTTNQIRLIKLYPEQMAEARFARIGHGFIYAYCNKHGLYRMNI